MISVFSLIIICTDINDTTGKSTFVLMLSGKDKNLTEQQQSKPFIWLIDWCLLPTSSV
jgi:hypothetical protein